MKKEQFTAFLKSLCPNDYKQYLEKFELYYQWLLEENQKVNLISRKTDPEDIWTLHFLDSLLAFKLVDFSNKKILDFGSGGGLPGIPIAIIYQTSHVTLLDSKKKKIASLKKATEHLKLNNCGFLDSRIEEIPSDHTSTYDLIVSRSVKMTPRYLEILNRLLAHGGKIVLYKGPNLEDTANVKDAEIYDASMPEIGERNIVVINKKDLV
ncbi:16S rRNA (guanine(527)-N(7))-methyltransferase RsmG [Chitinispirillales bacterium ANBcel5]|uniref:16S rRNA (guanine(527)-N(7))-methyltransferase RsmG n=1 Tax=Cellulosispirillum alkaliphilum TaxID=3039283 RepID=UPI002A57D028|nr:16S rRNA (guanine(527)-N(7))-methyltransferase RsmG [Chitinispirillales bacterium ANBcel5]